MAFNLSSLDWTYLFRGRRAYATLAVLACLVTALTVFGVSKYVQYRKEAGLYEKAQTALDKKDYDSAIKDLSELYKEDPNFKDTGVKLAEAVNAVAAATAAGASSGNAGGSSGGGSTGSASGSGSTGGISGTGTGGRPGTNQAPTPQAAKLVGMLPKSLKGYETMGTQVDNGTNSANRGFSPLDKRTVANLLISLYDRVTPEAGQAYVDSRKPLFPDSGKTLTVDGAQAYFGGDSRSINAILVWTKGSIVYELIMQSAQQNPSALEPSITAVADQL